MDQAISLFVEYVTAEVDKIEGKNEHIVAARKKRKLNQLLGINAGSASGSGFRDPATLPGMNK